MKTADLQHTRWAFKSTRLCSGSCLCTDGTLTTADDDTMKSRNNRSLSGDSVPLPGRVPEGCLLSCILKEIFSQNKPAQSVIKAPRWQSCPFMCSPLRALPFLLKRSQPSPSPSRSNNSTKVAYKTEVPGLMGWDAFEAAAKRINVIKVRESDSTECRVLTWNKGASSNGSVLLCNGSTLKSIFGKLH